MATTSVCSGRVLRRAHDRPTARPQPHSSPRGVAAHARGRKREAAPEAAPEARELTVGVAPAPPPPAAPASSSFGILNYLLIIPASLLAYKIFKVARRAMQGSMASIENRGHLERERDANGTVPWDADTVSASMKRVRYTDYDHLSDDQIEKARKRRLRERDVSSPSLEEVELPSNHPWATQDDNDELTEDLIKERLSVRRGIPRQSYDRQQQS